MHAPDAVLCAGVKTFFGITFQCKAVVLTTGTFMNGRIWIGRTSMPAGRYVDLCPIAFSFNITAALARFLT